MDIDKRKEKDKMEPHGVPQEMTVTANIQAEALKEARSFLTHMSFAPDSGAYAVGNHVAITIDPQWNDDDQKLHVHFFCNAFERWLVDWSGFTFWLRNKTTNVDCIVSLDRCGYALRKLKDLTYETHIKCVRAFVDANVIDKALFAGAPLQAMQATRKLDHRFASADRCLQITLKSEPQHRVQIRAQYIEQATVEFAFFDPESGEIERAGEIHLEQSARRHTWSGTWEREVILKRSCLVWYGIKSEE
jgi:hypothetical protein